MSRPARPTILLAAAVCLTTPTGVAGQATSEAAQADLLTVEHYVPVVSEAPSMEGATALIYVREKVLPRTTARARTMANRVVLFVHGAGTPAEVSFDTPGASWMAYLGRAGYDVFSMDMTGYGRSTRPYPMNDPCNLSEADQAALVPDLLAAPCAPTYGFAATTIESDWHDLDAVVEYVRELRQVESLHLVAWSLGGPRAGGYAARYPEKVTTLTLLSPAYSRGRADAAPPRVPSPGATMTKQSRADFDALWNRQLGCPDQYEAKIRESVWSEMLASDPVGATWGSGVRRAPRVTTWGWTRADVSAQRTPTLMFSPETDGQVPPARVTELYEDLGSPRKILAHLACSSHNAMWETNRDKLFAASLEWLDEGTVGGIGSGEIRLTKD